MVDRLIALKIVLDQLRNPNEETTVELLRNMQLVKTGDNYDCIYFEEYEDEFAFYFKIINRKFYFVCFTNKCGEYKYASIEPYSEVYLLANSKNYTKSHLEKLAKISFSNGWSIGDNNGQKLRTFTSGKIKVENHYFLNVESQLTELISNLINIKESIQLLKEYSECKIVVATWQHITNVNGLFLDRLMIDSISNLNLELDYMPYIFK